MGVFKQLVLNIPLHAASTTEAGGTGPRKGGPGPCLSRTGSVERNVEDQLLKDLQDSIERENDLKERRKEEEAEKERQRKREREREEKRQEEERKRKEEEEK